MSKEKHVKSTLKTKQNLGFGILCFKKNEILSLTDSQGVVWEGGGTGEGMTGGRSWFLLPPTNLTVLKNNTVLLPLHVMHMQFEYISLHTIVIIGASPLYTIIKHKSQYIS